MILENHAQKFDPIEQKNINRSEVNFSTLITQKKIGNPSNSAFKNAATQDFFHKRHSSLQTKRALSNQMVDKALVTHRSWLMETSKAELEELKKERMLKLIKHAAESSTRMATIHNMRPSADEHSKDMQSKSVLKTTNDNLDLTNYQVWSMPSRTIPLKTVKKTAGAF